MIKKIIYLTYTRPDYSLNSILIKGLKENGVEVLTSHIKDRGIPGFVEALSFYRRNSKNNQAVIIGYDSPALVIFLRPFCRKKIIFNAFLSVYERIIVSRELASRLSVKAVYYWLLDFLAVHFADLVRLESDSQAVYFKKLFKVPGRKLYRSWVGVDEDNFFYEPGIQKSPVFTVLFRGALMPEAGTEYVVRAAKILEDKNIRFIMIGGGILMDKIKKLSDELSPANLEHITEHMPYDKLREKMQKCHISLGQLSDHIRLTRTTPLKMFESLAMGLPYLTASNRGALELLKAEETCLTCAPADADSLADKILWAKDNYSIAQRIAENGYKLYQNHLKSHILAQNLLDRIRNL